MASSARGLHYSIEQLKHLRNSHLVHKPDNLPPIEQWIESTQRDDTRRPRTQNGPPLDKAEQSENTTVRRMLNAARQSHTGDEIFLGPKISFASASAARQPGRSIPTQDRDEGVSLDESSRIRSDRFRSHKEIPERSHDRHREQYGHDEGDLSFKTRAYEGWKERVRGGLVEKDNEQTGDNGNRRSAATRAKLDQPWIRNGPPAADTTDDSNATRDRNWRDNVKRHTAWTAHTVHREREDSNHHWSSSRDRDREEQVPQWMNESTADDDVEHTQDDFAKWKESMKAAEHKDGPAAAVQTVNKNGAQPKDDGIPPMLQSETSAFFGTWGEMSTEKKVQDHSKDAEPLATAGSKTTSKPKSSRFAGFFNPTQKQPEPMLPPAPQSPETFGSPELGRPQSQSTDADQAGFQRMMAMLRLGNTSQPPAADSHHIPPPQTPSDELTNNMTSPAEEYIEMRQEERGAEIKQQLQVRPGVGDRNNTEFLLQLMQKQQPRNMQHEGQISQIYGQKYHQAQSADGGGILMNPMHNQGLSMQSQMLAAKPPPREPPPGFYYTNGNGNDNSFSQNRTGLGSPLNINEIYGHMGMQAPPRTAAAEKSRHVEQARMQPQPSRSVQQQFEETMWQYPQRGQPQQPQQQSRPESQIIAPPPGFSIPNHASSNGNINHNALPPPGFFPYSPNNNMGHHQNQNQSQSFPHGASQMPGLPNQPFYGGPNPGGNPNQGYGLPPGLGAQSRIGMHGGQAHMQAPPGPPGLLSMPGMSQQPQPLNQGQGHTHAHNRPQVSRSVGPPFYGPGPPGMQTLNTAQFYMK